MRRHPPELGLDGAETEFVNAPLPDPGVGQTIVLVSDGSYTYTVQWQEVP